MYIDNVSLFILPLTWAIYEFRQFRLQLKQFDLKLKFIVDFVDKVSKNELEQFPFLDHVKQVSDNLKQTIEKVNAVLK